MLLEMQDGDSGDTKDDISYNINNTLLKSKIDYTSAINNMINNKAISNKQRVTNKVLSSSPLLQHILSYIPIDSLSKCSCVNNDWYLIIKYIVPIPLISLKTLAMGELLYWLPGENQFPKTVSLKLRFSSGVPKFIQITTQVNQQQKKHKNGFHKNGFKNGSTMTHSTTNENDDTETIHNNIVSRSGHYQMIELSEILFIIDGHWTPMFDQLNAASVEQDSFDHDESLFFHRSKCFSIVTNTYMTYDFISFNSEMNKCIVSTLNSIRHQTHELSSKMAIHAKANRKYKDALNQTPLIFTDTLSALNFEMFVLILQDCINKIGSELNINIPSVITTQANASLLYPMILEEDILFSDWSPWCRSHIFETLKSYGYIKQIDDNVNANNEYGIINDEEAETKDNNNNDQDDNKQDKEHIEVLYDRNKHHRRGSSLFGMKSFPMDETVDLFATINSDEEVMDEYDNHSPRHSHNQNNINNQQNKPELNDNDNDSNCLIM